MAMALKVQKYYIKKLNQHVELRCTYCIHTIFRGMQFSLLLWLTGQPQKLNPQNFKKQSQCIWSSRVDIK